MKREKGQDSTQIKDRTCVPKCPPTTASDIHKCVIVYAANVSANKRESTLNWKLSNERNNFISDQQKLKK